jgi:hypothetical protein
LDELEGFDLDGEPEKEEASGVFKSKNPKIFEFSHTSRVRILKHIPMSVKDRKRFVSVSFTEMIVWNVFLAKNGEVEMEKVLEV